MLKTSEYGCHRPEDLNHQDELNLASLIKAKFGADIFVLDKFPSDIRSFYTAPVDVAQFEEYMKDKKMLTMN